MFYATLHLEAAPLPPFMPWEHVPPHVWTAAHGAKRLPYKMMVGMTLICVLSALKTIRQGPNGGSSSNESAGRGRAGAGSGAKPAWRIHRPRHCAPRLWHFSPYAFRRRVEAVPFVAGGATMRFMLRRATSGGKSGSGSGASLGLIHAKHPRGGVGLDTCIKSLTFVGIPWFRSLGGLCS